MSPFLDPSGRAQAIPPLGRQRSSALARTLLIKIIIRYDFRKHQPVCAQAFFLFLPGSDRLLLPLLFWPINSPGCQKNSLPSANELHWSRPVSDTPPAHRDISLAIINHWIADLRLIPYVFTREWKTPVETESGAPADCKAKAIALYQLMQSHGATNFRPIIGNHTANSRSTHAWLERESKDRKLRSGSRRLIGKRIQ